MVSLPVQTSKKQLGRRSRVDTTVGKNGYINLDVRSIWMVTVATSSGTAVAEPDINPMSGFVGYGFRF